MREQLVLLDDTAPPWRLDEQTRQVGRRGVELARRALQRPAGASATEPHPEAA
jgi:hypothetical protein